MSGWPVGYIFVFLMTGLVHFSPFKERKPFYGKSPISGKNLVNCPSTLPVKNKQTTDRIPQQPLQRVSEGL